MNLGTQKSSGLNNFKEAETESKMESDVQNVSNYFVMQMEILRVYSSMSRQGKNYNNNRIMFVLIIY